MFNEQQTENQLEQDPQAQPSFHVPTAEPVLAPEASLADTPPDTPVDPWAQAFEQLAEPATADPQGDAPASPEPAQPDVPTAAQELPAPTEAPVLPQPTDAPVAPEALGGPVPPQPTAPEGHGVQAQEPPQYPEAVTRQVNQIARGIKSQAQSETQENFLNWRDPQSGQPMVRQTNGQLGATIGDPDIYVVGEDGVPEFRNPDTGKAFTGDDPRGQAQVWVDRYNKQLRESIATETQTRQNELVREARPQVELLRFAPKYQQLDPTRKAMLDGIIKDYEVNDAQGNHIGYSVNLNQALAQVDRQVKLIQANQAASAPTAAPAPGQPTAPAAPAATAAAHPHPAQQPVTGAPTSPAMNMPTGAPGGDGELAPPANLAEAMARKQDALLAEQAAKDAKRKGQA